MKKAVYYMCRASDQELSNAQVFLAMLYLRKVINYKNYNELLYVSIMIDKSCSDFKKMVDKINTIDNIIEPNKNLGIDLLNKAANQNYIPAYLMLGIIYSDKSSNLIPKDFEKSKYFFKKIKSLSI